MICQYLQVVSPSHHSDPSISYFEKYLFRPFLASFFKIYFYSKGRFYRERRSKKEKSTASFLQWQQWAELRWSEARSQVLFLCLLLGLKVPRSGPSSIALPGHKQNSGSEAEILRHKPVSTWGHDTTGCRINLLHHCTGFPWFSS